MSFIFKIILLIVGILILLFIIFCIFAFINLIKMTLLNIKGNKYYSKSNYYEANQAWREAFDLANKYQLIKTKEIYLAPDGELNRIPFEILFPPSS